MTLKRRPMRYAHQEGHTDVCYHTGEEGGLVTCGSDGDVRIWVDVTDDDPVGCCIAEQVTSIVSKDGKLYVGTDNNTVQILSYNTLDKEGLVTRFSASVSALASSSCSNLIASGACDMQIKVSNVKTPSSIELNGHEAPILGLSLDPKEEYVASSSADGSIRVWNIKEKKAVHVWDDVVTKCNSFFTCKTYSTPSFHCKDGSLLAYPYGKEVVVVKRSTWQDSCKLTCSDLKADLSICKFSACGTRLAACSISGEIVVWEVQTEKLIGYSVDEYNSKITSMVWNPDKPIELAYCNRSGQLGCVDVLAEETSIAELIPHPVDVDHENGLDTPLEDDQDDCESVISLNKIKASVILEDDEDVKSPAGTAAQSPTSVVKTVLPEVNVQRPFQPGSTPIHLLSRFMMWNDIGIVKCYTSEDGDESSIEVEFNDSSTHHALHINNYLRHSLAALSTQALVLACQSNEDTQSKVVVLVLQGWGSGKKEWSVELPQDEEAVSLAVGDTFVAVATSRRNLRLFMVGGTQREVLALPGPPVAMNGYENHLLVVYHAGLGVLGDQCMDMLWIRVGGANLRSQKLSIPLSPASDLMWLGMTDQGSPTIMDSEGVIKIYDRKSFLWRVACDSDNQCKSKLDHFFVIGVSEAERIVRCVPCKGSHYPVTTPRPAVTEIPLMVPLCEPSSEKSEKEAVLWQLGSDPRDEKEALFSLFALACRSNVEFRAVELCQQIATQNLLELAVKYAGRLGRMALANKLESIAEAKEQELEDEQTDGVVEGDSDAHGNQEVDREELPILTPIAQKQAELEIKPLPLSTKKSNPFLKSGNSPTVKGLNGLNTLPVRALKPTAAIASAPKKEPTSTPSRESFISWYARNEKDLQKELPELDVPSLTKVALKRYKMECTVPKSSSIEETPETKKRKFSDPETDEDKKLKRSASHKLAGFAFAK